jgi:carbonic anhydrase
MDPKFEKILQGYDEFRDKYVHGDKSVMQYLSDYGQQPQIMVVACCDSRVDPALILQCDPGDLFVVRNVANIIPPFEQDETHHGTSAALEFGICFLKVKHLIILGHSQCSGIQTLLDSKSAEQTLRNDFITNWVSVIQTDADNLRSSDACAKSALTQSRQNCLSFPWIKDKVQQQELIIHLWYFDIKMGQIFKYLENTKEYQPL